MPSYSTRKKMVSLCWKDKLWMKYSQHCSPLQWHALSGCILQEKSHARQNTDFNVFKSPDKHHEFLLLLITNLSPSSICHLTDCVMCLLFTLQSECCFLLPHMLVTWSMIVPSHFRASLASWVSLVPWEWKDLACSSLVHFIDSSALAACTAAVCRVTCRTCCFWNWWLRESQKEGQNRGCLGWWMVIELS